MFQKKIERCWNVSIAMTWHSGHLAITSHTNTLPEGEIFIEAPARPDGVEEFALGWNLNCWYCLGSVRIRSARVITTGIALDEEPGDEYWNSVRSNDMHRALRNICHRQLRL